jgi:hypothetical protein
LEDYVTATEKTQHAHGKEYERILKVGSIVLERDGAGMAADNATDG